MAKKSRRRPSRHERAQAGCMWSLISIFDFRHGRTTKRLLSDRGRETKPAVGHLSNQAVILGQSENCESTVDGEESTIPMPMADAAKISVKELMEEEMISEQGSENSPNDSEIGSEKSNSDSVNHLKKHQKKRNRFRNKSSDMDVSQLDTITENPNQRPSDKLDLEKILKELNEINERNTNNLKHDLQSDLDAPSDETMTAVEEKLVTAIKLFIEQRPSGSKRFGEEVNHRSSKEFMEALRTLSSNEGLYLKLLQDPDSKLVEHVQNLEDTQLGRDRTPSSMSASRLSEDKPINSKPDESNGRKPRISSGEEANLWRAILWEGERILNLMIMKSSS